MLDQTAFALSLVNDIIERDGKLLDLEPLRFEVAGHIAHKSSKGSKSGYVRLSMSRAKAVMDFMIKEGVKAEYLSCKGYGGTRPLSTRPEDNRRVEITVRNDEFDDLSDDDDDDDDDSDENTARVLLRDIDPDLDVLRRTNVRVGLVPGVNNSTIGEWNDLLYERTLRRIQEASKHGVVKGILWHQGESDCGRREFFKVS